MSATLTTLRLITGSEPSQAANTVALKQEQVTDNLPQ